MIEFHIQLKKAMEMNNINQSELCEKTGIPKSAMSQYMSGSFKPKQKRLFLIAKALNVSEAWLMGYENASIERNDIEKDSLQDIRYAAYQELEGQPEEVIEDVLNFIKFRKSQEKKD